MGWMSGSGVRCIRVCGSGSVVPQGAGAGSSLLLAQHPYVNHADHGPLAGVKVSALQPTAPLKTNTVIWLFSTDDAELHRSNSETLTLAFSSESSSNLHIC